MVLEGGVDEKIGTSLGIGGFEITIFEWDPLIDESLQHARITRLETAKPFTRVDDETHRQIVVATQCGMHAVASLNDGQCGRIDTA